MRDDSTYIHQTVNSSLPVLYIYYINLLRHYIKDSKQYLIAVIRVSPISEHLRYRQYLTT